MSESYSYDPETFHPSITHSVYVTLDDSRLRLAYPRTNIPRWASFEETQHEVAFLHAHIYQLANSKVSVIKGDAPDSPRGAEEKAQVTSHLSLVFLHPLCHPTQR